MSSADVNRHCERVYAQGGDFSTVNLAWLNLVDQTLKSLGLFQGALRAAVDVKFGVSRTGNVISKFYDYGTTLMPRGGDFTPSTATTLYSATAMSVGPGWVNQNNTSFCYWGGGLPNILSRQTQITIAALYQRTDTAHDICLVGGAYDTTNTDNSNGIQPGPTAFHLKHYAGVPGTIELALNDDTHTVPGQKTATTSSATQIVVATCDGTQLIVYSNGSAGTPATGFVTASGLLVPCVESPANGPPGGNTGALSGMMAATGGSSDSPPWVPAPHDNRHAMPLLGSGSHRCTFVRDSAWYQGNGAGLGYIAPEYVFADTEAKYNGGTIIILDSAVSPSQAAALTTLLLQRDVILTPTGGVGAASLSPAKITYRPFNRGYPRFG